MTASASRGFPTDERARAIKGEVRRLGMHEVQLDVIDTNPRARTLCARRVSGDRAGPYRPVQASVRIPFGHENALVVPDGG
ncbi:MAG: hypothetical protein Tsb0024_23440 [Ruegeria sp.]